MLFFNQSILLIKRYRFDPWNQIRYGISFLWNFPFFFNYLYVLFGKGLGVSRSHGVIAADGQRARAAGGGRDRHGVVGMLGEGSVGGSNLGSYELPGAVLRGHTALNAIILPVSFHHKVELEKNRDDNFK